MPTPASETTPLFIPTLPPASDAARTSPLQILLEWLTRVDQWHIRRSIRRAEKGLSRGVVSPLYKSGIRYRARSTDAEGEDWMDVPSVLHRGYGDEEDLVAWRCAELRVAGTDAEPVIHQEQGPDGVWRARAVVRLPDGRIEDPARILGRPASQPMRPSSSRPLLHLSLPETDDAAHFAPLQIALEGLTRINQWQIEHGFARARRGDPSGIVPPIYTAGVRYKEEAPGREDWIDAVGVLLQGHADCEDLAAWRCAELRVAGIPAEPVIKWQWIPRQLMVQQGYPTDKLPRRGVWMVHCCVRWPDGSIEDPSKVLGMGGNFTERI